MYKKQQPNDIKINHTNLINANKYINRSASAYCVQLLLANYSIPTLLKMKPSNLISINKKLYEANVIIKEIELEIERFCCKSFILYDNQDMVNLLIYSEKLLQDIVKKNENMMFLSGCGYDFQSDIILGILDNLKKKLEHYHALKQKQDVEFPHEIGIILGYPLEDVQDFVRYQGRNYLLSGCWKVYHNTEEALKIFESYRNVRQYVRQMIIDGKELKDILLY